MSFSLPDNFIIPDNIKTSKFIARKLCAKDAYIDYIAVMENIDFIQQTRGGKYLTPDLTFEGNFISLAWHQREFEYESSFAYVVMNPDETEYLGCFYIYPPGYRDDIEIPEGINIDADISFWVTQKANELGLYDDLYLFLKDFIKQWPFKDPYWSNVKLP